MGYKIIFSPQAIADLEQAVHFIARSDPDSAKRIGNALIDRVSILQQFPLLGSTYRKRSACENLSQIHSSSFIELIPNWGVSISCDTSTEAETNRFCRNIGETGCYLMVRCDMFRFSELRYQEPDRRGVAAAVS
jgi:plasmid stabilization system protein ParE